MLQKKIRIIFLLLLLCVFAIDPTQLKAIQNQVGQIKEQDATELTALRNDVEQIKQAQQEIAKSLQVIKDILMGKTPPLDNVDVQVEGSPTLGKETAEVTIVEFSDFQCPYCGTYARDVFGKIVDQYVKTGKVKYVVRNFPIEQLHPLAGKAAEAAMCANEQGKYWEAHALFFDNQPALDEVIRLQEGDATAIGINTAAFEQCIASNRYAELIKRDLAEGVRLGVKGTPTFFLGYSDVNEPSHIKAVKSLVGARPLQEFYAALDDLIKGEEEGRKPSETYLNH